MEAYYYQKMNKPQQAAYHAMQQGVLALADEIQLPRIPAEELYDVFFRLRLDHPEIFWVVSYRYRYYQDSPNIIFVPEYLFEKNKIREHQKAMQSRVEKLARPAAKLTACSSAIPTSKKRPGWRERLLRLAQRIAPRRAACWGACEAAGGQARRGDLNNL